MLNKKFGDTIPFKQLSVKETVSCPRIPVRIHGFMSDPNNIHRNETKRFNLANKRLDEILVRKGVATLKKTTRKN